MQHYALLKSKCGLRGRFRIPDAVAAISIPIKTGHKNSCLESSDFLSHLVLTLQR